MVFLVEFFVVKIIRLPIHITAFLRSVVATSKPNENDRFSAHHVFFLGNTKIFEDKEKLHSAFTFIKAYLYAKVGQIPFRMPLQTIFHFCGH